MMLPRLDLVASAALKPNHLTVWPDSLTGYVSNDDANGQAQAKGNTGWALWSACKWRAGCKLQSVTMYGSPGPSCLPKKGPHVVFLCNDKCAPFLIAPIRHIVNSCSILGAGPQGVICFAHPWLRHVSDVPSKRSGKLAWCTANFSLSFLNALSDASLPEFLICSWKNHN